MTDELSSFIYTVYRESYSFVRNNCIHKSLRIKAKAEEMGGAGDLICCLSILPIKKFHNFLSLSLIFILRLAAESWM